MNLFNIFKMDYILLLGINNSISKFAKKINKSEKKILIDFGCGRMPYKNKFPKNIRYIGVDLTSNKKAEIKIKENSNLPFKKKSIDIVISTQVIHKVKNYNNYLKNCSYVLKKKGLLFLTTHGNWTHHPAGSGDYYRFTIQGLKYLLNSYSFKILEIEPIIGTLGGALHIRQVVLNSWLKKIPLMGLLLCYLLNFVTNLRILLEDKLQSYGTSVSNPIAFAVTAKKL
jgi:ubiquinone/menaquinone biosynthesis C-methylase UbiE